MTSRIFLVKESNLDDLTVDGEFIQFYGQKKDLVELTPAEIELLKTLVVHNLREGKKARRMVTGNSKTLEEGIEFNNIVLKKLKGLIK